MDNPSILANESQESSLKVSVIGCGNVGIAISADLSLKGYPVTLIKSSNYNSSLYKKLKRNHNRIYLKENNNYRLSVIDEITTDLSKIEKSDIIFVALQSNFHYALFDKLIPYLSSNQILIIVCGYLSSFYISQRCQEIPTIIEQIGPYLEGRVEENNRTGEIVFRVGCRLNNCHSSLFQEERREYVSKTLKSLDRSFNCDYSIIEAGLLNPNMVLHTVGSIMSIPRIEYSHGNFCMYREAYSHDNNATINLMLALDEEKKKVLSVLGQRPIDIFESGGFLGNPMESFFKYSESSDRAISPTSIHSRYITEDVPQGLVLLESIAEKIGAEVPVTSSLITIAENSLGIDFRKTGRTVKKLGIESYIAYLKETA